jgi:hypothetical protein
MRIPDEMRDCTCFLCVKEASGKVSVGGTAFFMSFARTPMRSFTYLVTAKHCVTKAFEQFGNLYLRLNTRKGSTDLVELDRTWAYSEDEGVDVAVRPWQLDLAKYKQAEIDFQSSAHDKNLEANGIGIGNEVLAIGLFKMHHGTSRNIPIVRQGIIASMPEEPLVDRNSGLPYKAYLAEIQSVGGLSGSPVFVHVPSQQLLAHFDNPKLAASTKNRFPAGFLYLLGVIRGHFDEQIDSALDDKTGESVHSGIATVSPIQEVIAIVNENDGLIKARRMKVRSEQKKIGATNKAENDLFHF